MFWSEVSRHNTRLQWTTSARAPLKRRSIPESVRTIISAEGMKHALSTQTVGGVMLTPKGKLVRTVNVNVATIRELRGADEKQSKALQEYILALSLVSAIAEPDLNLREGCNLRFKGTPTMKLVYRKEGRRGIHPLTWHRLSSWPKMPRRDSLKLPESISIRKTTETQCLRLQSPKPSLARHRKSGRRSRNWVRSLFATLKRFDEQGKDPFKLVNEKLKAAKKALGKRPDKNKPTVKNVEVLGELCDALYAMSENASLPDAARSFAVVLHKLSQDHDDSRAALNEIETRIRNFKKEQKADSIVKRLVRILLQRLASDPPPNHCPLAGRPLSRSHGS